MTQKLLPFRLAANFRAKSPLLRLLRTKVALALARLFGVWRWTAQLLDSIAQIKIEMHKQVRNPNL